MLILSKVGVKRGRHVSCAGCVLVVVSWTEMKAGDQGGIGGENGFGERL